MSDIIQTLVTDRAGSDVLRWFELRNKGYENMTAEERAEWDAGNMKGAYNVSDLNRVGSALNYIRDRLADTGYMHPAAYTAKMNWTAAGIPTASDLSTLLSHVRTARGAFAVMSSTPRVPENVGGLSYIDANNIEKILVDLDRLITNMLAARPFCGELYSGEY